MPKSQMTLDMKNPNSEPAVHERVRHIRSRLLRLRRRMVNSQNALLASHGKQKLKQIIPEMQATEAANNTLPKR